MPTLTELTTPITKDEVQTAIYDAIEATGVLTTSWKPGAVARTIIAGASIVISAFSTLQAEIAKNGFLLLSSGDWLEVVAREVYGVTKNTGTFASGNVTLDNTGGGVYAVAIGDLTVLNSTTSKTYKNTAAFTLAAFETGKIVPVQAVEIGSDSSANANDIDTLETVLVGVTVNNTQALVGLDAETDPALQTRCLAKTGTLSPNGPFDAYRFLALSATTDDGTPAGVTRVTTYTTGDGTLDVYVATASGAVTGTIGDTTTPLGAVDEAIQVKAAPLAVSVDVISAVNKTVNLVYELWVKTSIGLTAGEIIQKVSDDLTAFIAAQPIGGTQKVPGPGYIYAEMLEFVVENAVGKDYLIDLVVTGGADVLILANEAPVANVFTPTINFVSV